MARNGTNVRDQESPGQLWAVVLAAGASQRLGQPKQLVRWRGETLIERSVRAAQTVCGRRVLVVLGAHASAIEPALAQLAPTRIVNARWADGLASSLRTGIEALPPDCAGVLLLTCDQPLVPVTALHALAQRWREHPDRAVASAYANTVGVPAVVPARLFRALTALSGDRGARTVLHAEGARLERVPLPEAEIDVDDESALRALAAAEHEEAPGT